MKIIRAARYGGVILQAFDALRFHVNDTVDVLQVAFDNKEGFFGDNKAIGFKHRGRDDGERGHLVGV